MISVVILEMLDCECMLFVDYHNGLFSAALIMTLYSCCVRRVVTEYSAIMSTCTSIGVVGSYNVS